MQVEIKIDDSCIEPRVIIITDKVTDEINDILNMLSRRLDAYRGSVGLLGSSVHVADALGRS